MPDNAAQTLTLAVVVGLNRMRNMQTKFAELHPQRLSGTSQQPSSLMLIAAGVFQHSGEQEPVQFGVRISIQIAGIGRKPLSDKRRQLVAAAWGSWSAVRRCRRRPGWRPNQRRPKRGGESRT